MVTTAPSDDEAADSAELDVIIERWASLGVDFVFATSSLDRPLAAAHRAGFEADWAGDEGSILSLDRLQSGATEAEIARTVIVQEPSVEVMYAAGDAPTVACVDNWDQKHPEEVAVFYPGEGELDNLQHVVRPCNQLETFKLIAEAAGPDLNPDTYGAAVAGLGKYNVAMQPFASLSADKSDAGDVVTLYSLGHRQGGLRSRALHRHWLSPRSLLRPRSSTRTAAATRPTSSSRMISFRGLATTASVYATVSSGLGSTRSRSS